MTNPSSVRGSAAIRTGSSTVSKACRPRTMPQPSIDPLAARKVTPPVASTIWRRVIAGDGDDASVDRGARRAPRRAIA